jgi:hypothetical protein
MLHTNLGHRSRADGIALRAKPVPSTGHPRREWELLSAANLLPQHAVLQETAAFLRQCRIPFLMALRSG